MDGERGRRLRLPNHVLHHARVGALVCGGHLAHNQGVVLQNIESVCKASK